MGLLAVAVTAAVSRADDGNASDENVDARLAAEQKKLELLDARLSSLRSELETLEGRESTLLSELHRLDVEIRLSRDELEVQQIRLQQGYREMDETLKDIQALEASIAELKPYLESRSKSLYKLGRLSYARLLLSVERPAELTRAYRYIARLAREDSEKMDAFLSAMQSLEKSKSALVLQTEQTLATREQVEATTRTLENRRASRAALLDAVNDRQEMAGTLVYELEQAQTALSGLVEGLGQGRPIDATVHVPLVAFEGEVGWPVLGELSGHFGTQRHPRFQTVTVRNGVEIDVPVGTSVHAVYEGEVVYAAWFQGYGRLLIIQHPGNTHSLYGYLEDFLVSPGDWVATGDLIGTVGETGSISGPGLYFELRVDGKPVDPEGWLHPARALAAN